MIATRRDEMSVDEGESVRQSDQERGAQRTVSKRDAFISKGTFATTYVLRKMLGREPDAFIGLIAKIMEKTHRAARNMSGGRLGDKAFGMQSLELHTIGRKSGNRHSTMLTAPIYSPDRVVVVASKGGSSFHPDWYKNLVANPTVEIVVRGQTRRYTAHTATAEEKAQLWPVITKVYPGYEGYQRNTDREIPLVVCIPA